MKRILGIDYGLKKIGLALGIGTLVEPFSIIENSPNHPSETTAIERISKIIENEKIDIVVIGIPLIKGKESGHAKYIKSFAEKLQKKFDDNVEIFFVDESKTSKESLEVAITAGISQKRRKDDHSIAAGLIIKRWWDSQPDLK